LETVRVDIAWQLDMIGNLDLVWDSPIHGGWYRQLSSVGRLILHDRRGTGLSTRSSTLPNLDTRTADLKTVLDEVGSTGTVVGGVYEGLAPGALLAATCPERVRAVVWWNPYPRTVWAPDYPWGSGPAEIAAESEDCSTGERCDTRTISRTQATTPSKGFPAVGVFPPSHVSPQLADSARLTVPTASSLSLGGRLRHVRWLAGASGAGKTTLARRLAAEHGLRVYDTDAAMRDHVGRLTQGEAPLLHAFVAMSMDERWVDRSPEEMLATFHWYAGDGFAAIVDDLLALAPEPVIAEGFRLLPDLVAPLAAPGSAVWLLPTPAFRRAAFETSGRLWSIAGRTSDPDRALANLLARDALFTERLRADVQRLGLVALTVDTDDAEDAVFARVRQLLGLAASDRSRMHGGPARAVDG
jgi:hypothetical protein